MDAGGKKAVVDGGEVGEVEGEVGVGGPGLHAGARSVDVGETWEPLEAHEVRVVGAGIMEDFGGDVVPDVDVEEGTGAGKGGIEGEKGVEGGVGEAGVAKRGVPGIGVESQAGGAHGVVDGVGETTEAVGVEEGHEGVEIAGGVVIVVFEEEVEGGGVVVEGAVEEGAKVVAQGVAGWGAGGRDEGLGGVGQGWRDLDWGVGGDAMGDAGGGDVAVLVGDGEGLAEMEDLRSPIGGGKQDDGW